MSIQPIDVVIDPGVGSVYLGLHKPEPGDAGGITHTMEKHGILLHWNGHGKLNGIEVIAGIGYPVHVLEVSHIKDEMP